MTMPPERPKIYHITHVENLPRIVTAGGLICDRAMLTRGGPAQMIGMSAIKRRRVEELVVSCYPDTTVGDYVPFYFCPRSIMLFVIHRANHPELQYRGGQSPIVHLEADLRSVVEWAEAVGTRWAFTLSNAGARYVEFRSRMDELDQLDWTAIAATDFRAPDIKEGKQAEFLLRERFPFDLVERIGVASSGVRARVAEAIADANHRPAIEIRPDWYF
jgi:hypothetical protein